MPIVKDRRSSLRVVIDGKALVHTERDQFEGRCIDLGLDGIALESSRAPRDRKLVTIEAVIDGQRLQFDASPARRRRQEGEYVLGFRFVDLDLDTRRRIEHLVFERLSRSTHAGFMRAFVAHAERVPPVLTRYEASDRTVVAPGPTAPLITGHTQIVAVGQLPVADRTMIAPRPEPTTTTVAAAAASTVMVMAPVRFDDSWFDDEMDTAEFRLLEEAQRKAAGSIEVGAELDVDPDPERTVVTEGEQLPPVERTAVTEGEPRPLVERTAVVPAASPHVGPRGTGIPERVALVHTPTMALVLEMADHSAPSPPPLLRGRETTTTTATTTTATTTAPRHTPAALVLRPTLRALLDAAAMLRRPDPAPRRGPRVIVAIPHRSYRRVAAMPWNA